MHGDNIERKMPLVFISDFIWSKPYCLWCSYSPTGKIFNIRKIRRIVSHRSYNTVLVVNTGKYRVKGRYCKL